MSRTLIQQLRVNNRLMAFWDFRGGNFEDQSGNGVSLTVPSDASLWRDGLRCKATPASFPLDMSATKNFCVFAYVFNWVENIESTNIIAEFTLNGTNTGGWHMIQFGTSANCLIRYGGSSGNTSGTLTANGRTDSYFLSGHIDRRLSYESVKGYDRGVFNTSGTTDNNTNDGSTFADDTVYLMGRGSNQFFHPGKLQVFGIIDFGTDSPTTQFTAIQQRQLYTEIRDRETI